MLKACSGWDVGHLDKRSKLLYSGSVY